MEVIARYPKSLDSYAIQFASDNLNETEIKRVEYVQQLRIHFKVHEPTIHVSDEDAILIAFLRGCKYNLDRTINKLKNYYKMRGELPEIFAQRDPEVERMQTLLSLGFLVPLRKFSDDKLVVIVRPACFDPKEFQIKEVLKVGYIILDICSRICPQVQIYGVCALFDLEGIGMAHAKVLTPSIVKHIVNSWENYHCRPKQLEFFNGPSYINIVINIFRSFMSAKMKQRLHVHNNGNASLYEIMDKSILPIEYGGDDGPLEDHIRFWNAEVKRHKAWLLKDQQFVAEVNDG